MNAGILATAWMCLVLNQAPNDVSYCNYRNHRFEVNFDKARRAEISQVLLFVSTDQGRNWHIGDTITADKDAFAYYAPADGTYWLSVATVDRQGKQDPDDKAIKNGAPHQKIIIDTLRPIVKSISAQRHGDEVFVSWDVQEDNPDRDGIRLEYQTKDNPTGAWTPVPGPLAANGQGRFRPGNNLALVVRLTVRDLAKNESFAQAEVAGTVATAGFSNPGPGNAGIKAPVQQVEQALPVLPGQLKVNYQPSEPVKTVAVPPPAPVSQQLDPPTKAPSTGMADSFNPNAGLPRPPVVTPPSAQQYTPPPLQYVPPPMPAPPKREVPAPVPPTEQVIADSRVPLTPTSVKSSGGNYDPTSGTRPVATSGSGRKSLPVPMHVNNHLVTLEYELKRVGPSGVAGVELWLTKDDGESWELYAKDEDVGSSTPMGRQRRTFDFRDKDDAPFQDGVYGLILAVKNRAGLGRKPRPGDAPEIRIEIDTQKPVAVLYNPVPDPQRPDQVLLKWFAQDKSLVQTPIQLEYAEKIDGPWTPISAELENKGRYTGEQITGDYSWKVPAGIPVQVYLRLRVRDKAGNEGVAVTRDPQFLDLTEPEGALIGVQPASKMP